MTQLAREKIQEALFFLSKLKENSDDDEFRYHLSAFLSSTWSVFDHLKTEWSHNGEFKEWIDKREDLLRDDPFCYFMIRARNCVIHFGRLEPKPNVEVVGRSTTAFAIENKGEKSEFVEISVNDEDPKPRKVTHGTLTIRFLTAQPSTPEIAVDAPRYFDGSAVDAPLPDNYKQTPVIHMCEEFLEEMRSTVELAEERFEFIPDPNDPEGPIS